MADSGKIATFANGRYQVLDRLGSGGTATVYKVRDSALDVVRALKVLRVGSKDMERRLAAEARAMAKLDHPNILQVHDVGAEAGRPFVVMEYVSGGTLADVVDRGAVDAASALRWTVQILGALSAAHAMGVVHRDVKPSNVLLDDRGDARLADFGIALFAGAAEERSTRTGVALGTLAYMAPEQRIDARSVSVAADVYAVGATLFTLLTARTPMDLFVAEANDARFRGLPAAVVDVIVRATRYAPSARYHTADAMADALAPLVVSAGPAAYPVGTPSPRPRRGPPPEIRVGASELTPLSRRGGFLTRVAPTPWVQVSGAILVGAAAVLGGAALLRRAWPPPESEVVPEPSPTSVAAPRPVATPVPAPAAEQAPVVAPDLPAPDAAAPAARPASAPAPAPSPPPDAPTGPFPVGAWVGVLDARPVDVRLTGAPDTLVAEITAWFSAADRAAGTDHRRSRRMQGRYDADTAELILEDVESGEGRGRIRAQFDGRRFRGAFETFDGAHHTAFEAAPPSP